MTESTIYDLSEIQARRVLEHIKGLEKEHQTVQCTLLDQGKSYRSYEVSYQNGYLSALSDVVDYLKELQKER